jgi:hypothetical protein
VKSNVVSQGNTKETSSVEKTSERKKNKRKITDESRMKEKWRKSKKAKLVKSGTDEDNIMQTEDLDEKNRGRWMKGKVVKYVKGKDGAIRGVILLHKCNYLERPVQLVCPLEMRSVVKEDQGRHNESTEDNDDKDQNGKQQRRES